MHRCAPIVLLGCLLAGGCRLPQRAAPTLAADGPPAVELCQAELPAAHPADAVKVTYATDADRLNVASGGGALPSASRCLLWVESPHPAGRPGLARVTLAVAPQTPRAGWWERRFGKTPPPTAPSDVRVLDVPQQEVQSLIQTLDAERFFVRSKPLTTDAFVGVERNGERFAKDFRSLPQLDALVLKAHRQGIGAGVDGTVKLAAGGADQCVRLPPVSTELRR